MDRASSGVPETPPLAFSSRRAIAPMMWVLVALATCELVIVHLLVGLWSPLAALLLSLATVPVLIWLVRGIASLATLPTIIAEGRIILRAGRIKSIAIPVGRLAGVREHWDAGWLKRSDVLNLSLIAHPNVAIDLAEPMTLRGRSVRAVAHRLDDPGAFVVAIEALRRRA